MIPHARSKSRKKLSEKFQELNQLEKHEYSNQPVSISEDLFMYLQEDSVNDITNDPLQLSKIEDDQPNQISIFKNLNK